VRRLALTALLVFVGACGPHSRPAPSGVITLAPGPPSAYRSITATGPVGSRDLTADLREAAVPLLAARAFARPQPLVEYGLDHPQGGLHYEPVRGPARDIAFGGLSFDGRAIYASRPADSRVFLVFVDRLRPVLTAIGILPVAADREPQGP
jgi:hypothetical protein